MDAHSPRSRTIPSLLLAVRGASARGATPDSARRTLQPDSSPPQNQIPDSVLPILFSGFRFPILPTVALPKTAVCVFGRTRQSRPRESSPPSPPATVSRDSESPRVKRTSRAYARPATLWLFALSVLLCASTERGWRCHAP